MNSLPEFIVAGEALTDMIRTSSDTWQSRVGGAGLNAARVMATLGVSSAFAGAVSTDCFGKAILEEAKSAGLDTRFLQTYDKAPLLAIVHDTSPVRYFFIGDDSADLYFDPERLPKGWQSTVRFAHFGGISLTREPLASRLLNLANALKKEGVKISYDPNFRVTMSPAYDTMLEKMCALADVIKVSDEDLCGLFRTNNETLAFDRLCSLAPHALCFVSRGDKDSVLCRQNETVTLPTPKVTVIDTVGAGDAAISGLVFSVMRHKDRSLKEHLAFATACGSAACTLSGAGIPETKNIFALFESLL